MHPYNLKKFKSFIAAALIAGSLSLPATPVIAQTQVDDAERVDCANQGGIYDWKSGTCSMPGRAENNNDSGEGSNLLVVVLGLGLAAAIFCYWNDACSE